MEKTLESWIPSPSVPCESCYFLAGLLESIRNDCERDFIHPLFTRTVNFILEKLEPFTATVHESAFRLYAAAFNLRGGEEFCKRFSLHISNLLNRLRERSLDQSCFKLLTCAFSVYYFVYPDAWATYLDRTENCISVIFPVRRKHVLSCDESVDEVVQFVSRIIEKLPKFAFNELVKKLVKQCSSAVNEGLDNVPLDRLNIAIRALTHLQALIEGKSASGHLKQQLADLSITSIKNDVSDVIGKLWNEIEKAFWNLQKWQLQIDQSSIKLINLLRTILHHFAGALKNEALIRLMDFELTAEEAKEAWNRRLTDPMVKCQMNQDLQCHRIACLIFNHSIAEIEPIEANEPIFHFFVCAFRHGKYELPGEVDESGVLRSGIAAILDALSQWDSKNMLQESTLRLEDAEVEHFGRIVDVYFVLLGRWEALVKEVYLETIGRGNFIVRSWGSLVGFKQKSKEIADFLCSLLGATDDRLRQRILNSFKLIPGSRVPEFVKLFERFRLPVSDDLVHLRYEASRRNRRNERAKLEVTRFYAHVMAAAEITSLWVYKAALRHAVELFYFLLKLEIEADDFILKLRKEFSHLLFILAGTVNDRCDLLNWRSFFPKRFQAELRKALVDWRVDGGALAELVHVYDEEDRGSIVNWILNDCGESFVTRAVCNCLQSAVDYENILAKFVEAVCNEPEENKNIFHGILAASVSDNSVEFLKILYGESEISQELVPITTELLLKVNSGAIQRRLLQSLAEVLEASEDEGLLKSLLLLTSKLQFTFPHSLTSLWVRLTDGAFAFLVHFLLSQLCASTASDDVIAFICRGLYDFHPQALLSVLLVYAHPYSGVQQEQVRNYLQASATILNQLEFEDCDIDSQLRQQLDVLLKLNYAILDGGRSPGCGPFGSQEDLNLFAGGLLTWATQCPLKSVSWAAWRELRELAGQLDDSFVRNSLLVEMTKFLQHMVCPESFHYFDPFMVAEILQLGLRIVSESTKISKETIQHIFVDSLTQLETVDDAVFDVIVEILLVSLEFQEIWNFLGQMCNSSLLKLHSKLVSNGLRENHFALMKTLLKAECNGLLQNSMSFAGREERFFCYLVASLPQIFSFFDCNLALERANLTAKQENESLLSYLNALIWLTQSTANSSKTDDVKFLYLEVGEWLASVESGKTRSSSDFYTILANLLTDKSVKESSIPVTMKLITNYSTVQSTFFVKFAESLRRERWKANDCQEFALKLIESQEVDQSVLDFLLE